jgi:DNA-binding MarR family transcriptional regulator
MSASSKLVCFEGILVEPLDATVRPSSVPDPAAIDLPPTTSVTIDVALLLQAHAAAISGSAASRVPSPRLAHDDPGIEPVLALISRSVAGAIGVLELPHLRVLVLLSQNDSMLVSELATLMKLPYRRAFELLDVMESSDWIATDSSARGLGERIRITPQGRQVVESITAGRQREIDEILDRLSAVDRARLAHAFNAFAAAAGEDPVIAPRPEIAT